MRKLATVRTINSISPIHNADRIEVAKVDGWEVVVAKGVFSVGDKVVYVEIDSKMPETPEYDFLESRKYIVKTIKMRGQISQGLILPMSVLPDSQCYEVGDDVTEILGIKKHDPESKEEKRLVDSNVSTKNPVIKFFLRRKWFRELYYKRKNKNTAFPAFIKKTDENRIQNEPKLFQSLKDNDISLMVTEKVDGTSATYFLKRKSFFGFGRYEFGVCSRNKRLPKPDNSSYWEIAKKYDIKNVLKELIGDEKYVVLQGEIIGTGIQKNKYNRKDRQFCAFNLIFPDKKYDTLSMQHILAKYEIFTVPIVTLDYKVPRNGEINDVVEFVKGKSQIEPVEREGCVFRNNANNISFKCINPDFLIKNNE